MYTTVRRRVVITEITSVSGSEGKENVYKIVFSNLDGSQ